MENKFPTAFYESNGIQTCPNGDKIRSDENGLFCWIEGERVPFPIPDDWTSKVVEPPASETPEPKTTKSRKKGSSPEQPLEQPPVDPEQENAD